MQAWEKAYQYDDSWKSYAPNVCGMLIKHGDLERALKYINWISNPRTRSYYIGKIRHLQGDKKGFATGRTSIPACYVGLYRVRMPNLPKNIIS